VVCLVAWLVAASLVEKGVFEEEPSAVLGEVEALERVVEAVFLRNLVHVSFVGVVGRPIEDVKDGRSQWILEHRKYLHRPPHFCIDVEVWARRACRAVAEGYSGCFRI